MRTVLANGDLLTMNDGPLLLKADLWIRDGKIERIVKRSVSDHDKRGQEDGTGKTDICRGQLPGDETTELIDCTGCVIMPGLIDSHCHYDDDYMGDFFLAGGVTSVRNMRGYARHARWRDEILEGKRRGPYIFSSGPVFDGTDTDMEHSDNVIISRPEDVEKAVDYTKDNGFLWVKTYPSIEPEVYRALMEHCRKENIRLCGHMTKKMDHKELADHGYICCEHTSSLPADPEEIRYLAESGMWLCPTHVVCETMPDYVWGEKQLKDIPHYSELPQCIRDEWEMWNKVIIEEYHRLNVHPDFQQIINRALTFLKYSDRIMAGTDCAYPGIIPGFSMADEIGKLVNVYGMSRYDALAAATSRPAEHMEISDRKGRILEGMDADLIILEGDPLEDTDNIRKIRRVYQGVRSWSIEVLQQYLTADGILKKEEIESIREPGGDIRTAI